MAAGAAAVSSSTGRRSSGESGAPGQRRRQPIGGLGGKWIGECDRQAGAPRRQRDVDGGGGGAAGARVEPARDLENLQPVAQPLPAVHLPSALASPKRARHFKVIWHP